MANRTLTAIFLRQREMRIRFIGRACEDVSTFGALSRILYRETLAHERRKLAMLSGGRDVKDQEGEPAGPSSP
jgi:hypothetical protein